MKRTLQTILLWWIITNFTYAQNIVVGIPDSAKNITVPNGLVSYNIQNPLGHTGNGFTNTPIAVLIAPNNKSHQLYFYDLDLNVPSGAMITGVEVLHGHGGCNSGSYTIDSLYLAYNGAIISSSKRDSASATTYDTLGGISDLWGATLTDAIVNDNSFGIILQSTTSGICTFGQFNLQVKVYYSFCVSPVENDAIPDSAKSITVPNGLVSYNTQNPLGHNGSGFTNAPIAVLITPNNKSHQLYFYDLDLNVPSGANITGVEISHAHGGCNSGSYTIDSLYLAYNGFIISNPKRDSASATTYDTLGGTYDLWGATLTDTIVNDNSFGIILQSTTSGICTFGQFDLRVKVFYCINGSYLQRAPIHSFRIFPNPTSNFLQVEFKDLSSEKEYKIFDCTGHRLLQGRINIDKSQINVQSLDSGFYILHIEGHSEKFIKM